MAENDPIKCITLLEKQKWAFQMHCYPKAISAGGKTFFVALDTSVSPWRVMALTYGGSWTKVSDYRGTDPHGFPSIGVLPDGRLIVFYNSHSSEQYYRISINPYDTSLWSEEFMLPGTGYSYPQPILFKGRLYLFIRWVTYDGPPLTPNNTKFIILETMDGKSWSPPRIVQRPLGKIEFGYSLFRKQGDKIIMSAHGIIPSENDRIVNLYFAWTNDTYYWFSADGSFYNYASHIPPIWEGEGAKYTYPLLDKDGKPVVMAYQEPYKLRLCRYSNVLGYSGTWASEIVKWQDGKEITFSGYTYPFILDGKLSFFILDGGKVKLLQHISNFLFSPIYEEPGFGTGAVCFETVQDSDVFLSYSQLPIPTLPASLCGLATGLGLVLSSKMKEKA
jgi:hypothetical protein